ncbi:MAG: glycosyltransferase [Candidatus Nezhaarchaeales archaeon]
MGLGHAARSLIVGREMKRRGWNVVFSAYGDEACNLIRMSGFKLYEEPDIAYQLKPEGAVDFRLTIAKGPSAIYRFIRQLGCELSVMIKERPDVVISDSRLSTVMAAYLLGKPCLLIVNQVKIVIPKLKPPRKLTLKVKNFAERVLCELLGVIWCRSRAIFIVDFPPPYTISKDNLEIPAKLLGKVKLVGPIIERPTISEVGKTELKRRLGLSGEKLIYASISGSKAEKGVLLKKVVYALANANPNWFIVVSMGDPANAYPKTRKGNVEVHGWVGNRSNYLEAADVLVTHGGHGTLVEALYHAVPMIVVPIKGHTERMGNAKAVEKLGVAKVVVLDERIDEGLKDALEEVLYNPSYRVKAKELKSKVLRYNGLKAVVEAAMAIAEKS